MEKRRSPRYSINLDALVHPGGGRSWLCAIKDFCDGGMLLVEQQTGSRAGKSAASTSGEIVGIHFSIPGQNQYYRLEGVIVRVMDSGIGINFPDGMPEDAMTALLEYTNNAGSGAGESEGRTSAGTANRLDLQPSQASNIEPAAGSIKPAAARKIIGDVRAETVKILPEMGKVFFEHMNEKLLAAARDARTNAEQNEYFAIMTTLEKAREEVGTSFADEVLDQIDNPRSLKKLLEAREKAEAERKASQGNRVKLSLVDTDDFEDWLAVANIISRAERSYEQHLKPIRQRLGMLVDSWGHSEANPVGVAVICHAFDNAMDSIDLPRATRQQVYSGFEAKVIPLLRRLYVNVNDILETSGVFPDLDEDYISPITPRSADLDDDEQSEEQPTAEEDSEPEEDSDQDIAEEVKGDQPRRAASQRSGRTQPQAANEGRPRQPPPGQQQTGPAPANKQGSSRSGEVGKALSSIYNTVRNLMTMQEQHQDEFEGELDTAEVMELEEVEQMLTRLQQSAGEAGQRVPVRQRLMEEASQGERPRRLPQQTLNSLGMVENLVDAMEHDTLLTDSARTWIRQLEMTLDKVAAREGDDFLDPEHPNDAMEVVNHLAQLGGAESASVKRNVDKVVRNITERFDDNPQVFSEALDQLKPLTEKESRAFSGNVQRTVKASEGQQTLFNAQQAVVDEMDRRLAGREIPRIVLELLVPGWRNLLVNTHLRQGKDSTDWQKHVAALEQVFEHLDSGTDPRQSPNYIEPEELLEHIEKGLDSIAFEPGQRVPLLKSLRRMLVEGESAGEQMPVVEMAPESVAETLGFADITRKEQKRQEIREVRETERGWEQYLQRAMRLHVGEWLEFHESAAGKTNGAEIAIVAWTSEDHANLVFVNRRGVKTHERTVEEMAANLMDETARVLEESDIPLTDRASHRMLQNMHNQLAHQAAHDELTGLVNRKEFERQLQRALGLVERNDTTHVVAYMDLDQFKVVNNAGGHDAGDKLLKNLTEELLVELGEWRDGKYVLSRLGGDEFGLLIEDCDQEAGLAVVKRLSDTVRAFRFEWQGDVFSLTSSCGVVCVDSSIDSVSAILRGADAACISAKEGGRDRIQIYKAGDSDVEHRRDIMEFVGRIDKALEENRFVLNCQKIMPIADAKEEPHYEILLTVLDENGQPLPPQDFIVAAETYNRMGQIDRWVIKNAFQFIAANILKLDKHGAFSINISGNSLREEGFMEFVLDQFKETRLPTSKICFEITETSAIGSLDDAIDFMQRLKITGVKFSLDDFGTGLSSYSYLRNLPVDYLKIDGTFVKDLKTSPNDYAVVKSINEIGHFMGKKTIAEFVENDEIMEILREIGVDFAQGYGIGKKLPITELLR